jgi:hypothetical protein
MQNAKALVGIDQGHEHLAADVAGPCAVDTPVLVPGWLVLSVGFALAANVVAGTVTGFTIASQLARPAFAPYLAIIGDERDPYQQAAGALVAFGLTWIAMIFISLLGRGRGSQVQLGGAR